MKRLQFRPPGATFGASGAPGRGDADYDGLGADFQIDSENGPGAAGTAGIRKIDEHQLPKPIIPAKHPNSSKRTRMNILA